MSAVGATLSPPHPQKNPLSPQSPRNNQPCDHPNPSPPDATSCNPPLPPPFPQPSLTPAHCQNSPRHTQKKPRLYPRKTTLTTPHAAKNCGLSWATSPGNTNPAHRSSSAKKNTKTTSSSASSWT